jgi:hypothetical protein
MTHILIDVSKTKLSTVTIGNWKPFFHSTFFIDQFSHLMVIMLTVCFFNKYYHSNPFIKIPFSEKTLLTVLGYLICLKPSNILIKETFGIYKIKVTGDNNQDLLNAGKLIGNIERVLTLTLFLIGHFEAIGFLIAGKSILRYEGVKTSKTEYVLIGTLMSFGIAIITGVLITKFPY